MPLRPGNRDHRRSYDFFKTRKKTRNSMYHFFWQIAQRWATRGIGFSQKIDFSRIVRLAGGFAAADPISLTSIPRLFSIPTCYSAAFTASNGKLDLPGSLLLYSQLVWLTYDLSRGNCVGGATHSRLCVPYFYHLLRAARWNCTPFPLHTAAYERCTVSPT